MNPLTYNASLLIGIALIGAGLALLSIPVALTVVGALVLAFTVFGALIARK